MDVNTMLVAIAAECTHPAVEVRYDPVERLYEATLRSPDVDPGRPVTRTGRTVEEAISAVFRVVFGH